MKQLTESVLATLIYHDLFDYPLKKSEIIKFLIQTLNSKPKILNKFKYSKLEIQNSLRNLIKNKKIFRKHGFYFLPAREKLVQFRLKREKSNQEKLKKAKKLAKFFKFFPWVKMTAVTGALAMKNANKDDDIDFLVITAKNRLWFTRIQLVIFLEILGQRRRPNAKGAKSIKDKICLNMFLDEKALALTRKRQNLFTAHEIGQMRPILNKNHTYEKFLLANLWVRNYLPKIKAIKQLSNFAIKEKEKKTLNYYLPMTQLLNRLEKLAYRLQLKYMKSKQTLEQVGAHFAFFHPQNRSQKIIKQYQEKINF